MLNRILNTATHKLREVPILVLMPHSRCNCRCVMCDIWKANHEKREISVEDLNPHLAEFRKLGVRNVTLSGGEALMHSNLWKFCEALASIHVRISLLSTGLALKNHAEEIVHHCQEVIVSLDGNREIHNLIRNIPNAFEKLSEGIASIKILKPRFRITGRSVIQKKNFRALKEIIKSAHQLGLDQISFLPADISSEAFNRPVKWDENRSSEIALSSQETIELEELIEAVLLEFNAEIKSNFIAESPGKLRDITKYYRALLNGNGFPVKKCNAPWVSAVIEANGDIRPCFFHKPYGNLHSQNFEKTVNSPEAIAFRKNLDIRSNEICEKCVCSLYRR